MQGSGIYPAQNWFVRSKVLSKAELPLAGVEGGFDLRFNLAGLVVFSVGLIFASGALVFALMRSFNHGPGETLSVVVANSGTTRDAAPAVTPVWGELVTSDVQLENPEEYLATDFDTSQPTRWVFEGMPLEKVRAQLTDSGLTARQIERALAPTAVTTSLTNTILRPDPELVLSLSAAARGKLYGFLARTPANIYMYFPTCFPANSFEAVLHESKVAPETIALIKPLLYQRGTTQYFSDYEVVMQRVAATDQRRLLLKALSRQPAVLARLRIRPTTDVEKVLGYWTAAPGVHLKDLRPLLESLQRLPEGGSVSLMYLLPPFARERLYTFPLPPKAGDPAMDCHWSSLNFFNEQPDDRLGNPSYAGAVLTKNYYPVQTPHAYGDVIVIVDEKNNGLHSAVYIADNIVFTKNGNSHQQPWMLMRLDNLLATYSVKGNVRAIVYRQKSS